MRIRTNNKWDWGGSVRDRLLSSILVLALLGALGMLVYVIATPTGERFTEFYLLGFYVVKLKPILVC